MERQGFDVIMNWSVKEFKAGLTEVGHTALRDRTEDNKADFVAGLRPHTVRLRFRRTLVDPRVLYF